jgi:hypothetical protein
MRDLPSPFFYTYLQLNEVFDLTNVSLKNLYKLLLYMVRILQEHVNKGNVAIVMDLVL